MVSCIALLLALALLFPAAAVPAEPAPPADANQEVAAWADALFAQDDAQMLCFCLPGTGPVALPLDAGHFQQPVKDLLAGQSWQRQETYVDTETPYGAWSLTLSGGGVSLTVSSNSPQLQCGVPREDGSGAVWYTAQSGESLLPALADLWHGPDLRYAMVSLPDQADTPQTLASRYGDAFQSLYLASDAITGFQLTGCQPLEETPGGADPVGLRLTYALRPADLGDSCWQYSGYTAAGDGWLTFSMDVYLGLDGDGVWRCAYYQLP